MREHAQYDKDDGYAERHEYFAVMCECVFFMSVLSKLCNANEREKERENGSSRNHCTRVLLRGH